MTKEILMEYAREKSELYERLQMLSMMNTKQDPVERVEQSVHYQIAISDWMAAEARYSDALKEYTKR